MLREVVELIEVEIIFDINSADNTDVSYINTLLKWWKERKKGKEKGKQSKTKQTKAKKTNKQKNAQNIY